jgi:hypothetical protein
MHLPTYARIPIPFCPHSFPNPFATLSRWRFLAALAGLVLPLLTGCEAPLSVDTFCQRFANANIAQLSRCDLLDDAQTELAKKTFLLSCNRMVASYNSDPYEFSVPLAQSCLDEITSRTCFSRVEDCQAKHRGDRYGYYACDVYYERQGIPAQPCIPFTRRPYTRRFGAACSDNWSCGDELHCKSVASGTSCGVCVGADPTPDLSPCGSCKDSFYCDTSTNTCIAKTPQGGACDQNYSCLDRPCFDHTCDYQKLGGSCVFSTDCHADAFCKGGSFMRGPITSPPTIVYGVCTARIATGGACTDQQIDDGCAEKDASCLQGVCKVVSPHSLAEGEVCDAQVQCAPPLFCAGLFSPYRKDGVCKPAAQASLGQSCGYPISCAPAVLSTLPPFSPRSRRSSPRSRRSPPRSRRSPPRSRRSSPRFRRSPPRSRRAPPRSRRSSPRFRRSLPAPAVLLHAPAVPLPASAVPVPADLVRWVRPAVEVASG